MSVRHRAPPAPERQAARDAASVFVSYAREDAEFVRELTAALEASGWDVWVDTNSIPWSAEWRRECEVGIQGAEAVLVVLSPDWVASETCRWEAETAQGMGKRLVPLLRREVDPVALPPAVAALNWIPALADGWQAPLIEALETDLEWARLHTRFLVAAHDWDAASEDKGLLLRGTQLREGERLLLGAAEAKEPAPTPLQIRFVTASRQGASRRQRLLIGVISLALVVLIAATAFAWIQRREAIEQSNTSRSRELATRSLQEVDTQADEALRDSIAAVDAKRTPEALRALRAAFGAPHVVSVLEAEDQDLTPLARSPDGRWFLARDEPYVPYLVDLEADQPQARVVGGGIDLAVDGAHFTEFSANGRRFVDVIDAARRPGEAEFPVAVAWSTKGPEVLRTVPRYRGGDDHFGDGQPVVSAALSADGKHLAALQLNGRLRVVDLVARGDQHSFCCQPDASSQGVVEVSPDGDWAITYVAERGLLWDTAGTRLPVPIEHAAPIHLAVFSPDGRTLTTSSVDGVTRVWDVAAQTERFSVQGSTFARNLSFRPDDSSVFAVASGTTAELWDTQSGERRGLIPAGEIVETVRFTAEWPLVITTHFTSATLWNATTGSELASVRASGGLFTPSYHDGEITFLEPDGDRINVWSDTSVRVLGSVPATGDLADSEVVVADGLTVERDRRGGRRALAVAGEFFASDVAVVFDPTREQVVSRIQAETCGVPVQNITFLYAMSYDEKAVASFVDDCSLDVWDIATGRRRSLPIPKEGENGLVIALSRDHRLLAIVSVAFNPDGTRTPSILDVWNVATGDRIARQQLDCGDCVPTMVAFGPAPALLAVGTEPGTVELYDSATVTDGPRSVLEGHGDAVRCLAFSPDGEGLVSGSDDRTAIVWDVTDPSNPTQQEVLAGHEGGACAEFSRDGQYLGSLAADVAATYRIWDAEGAEVMRGQLRAANAGYFTFDQGSTIALVASEDRWLYTVPCEACIPVPDLLTAARARSEVLEE